MKHNGIKRWGIFLLTAFVIASCEKNSTTYYPDAEANGVAIFSDKGNNLMSCFIDHKPWRTADRISHTGFFPAYTEYEITITKQHGSSLMDTLFLHWYGHYNQNDSTKGTLSLVLAVPGSFNYRDFSALQGQRLRIDTGSNGYFIFSTGEFGFNNRKGNGSIYFHAARLDSIAPNQYSGIMSGLLEADLGSFKITRGRFDHVIEPDQVQL